MPWLAKAPFATIVNNASGQGLLPNTPNMTAYAASKAGVNLTRALAAELAPSIRVNSVYPGMVDTPMTAGLQREVDRYALKRIAEPMEIARIDCLNSLRAVQSRVPRNVGISSHSHLALLFPFCRLPD